MKTIKQVSLDMILDELSVMRKAKFTFPKETQFLGVELIDESRLNIFYMAPEENFDQSEEFEEYDFISISFGFNAFTIPNEFEFLDKFSWGVTTFGVFFRKV